MADFFLWDAAKYGLRVKQMDAEHQTLIGHMNRLYVLHDTKSPKEEQHKELQALVKFTKRHFSDEEKYMEHIQYPELKAHQAIHQELITKLLRIAEDFEKTGKLTDFCFVFLRLWLTAHICKKDMDYAEHSRKRSAAGA